MDDTRTKRGGIVWETPNKATAVPSTSLPSNVTSSSTATRQRLPMWERISTVIRTASPGRCEKVADSLLRQPYVKPKHDELAACLNRAQLWSKPRQDVDTTTSVISMPCSKKLAAQRPEHTVEKQSGHGSSTHASISAACNQSHKMGDIGAGHSAARSQRE